jgi:hypothetical protein
MHDLIIRASKTGGVNVLSSNIIAEFKKINKNIFVENLP